ncbi:MAG: outer membrane lipoprotein-sorting protein [Verrucomicrobiales bacterium]|jgi:outer membrane lipoprotein-sorting protein
MIPQTLSMKKFSSGVVPVLLFGVAMIGSFRTTTAAPTDVNIEPVKQWIEKQAAMKSAVVSFTQERRLRSLKRPIVKQGKFWFQAPSTFRWELGQPAEMIAVQKEKKDLFVVRVKENIVEQHPYEKVVEEGSRNGLSFLESGFPRDLAQFQKNFEILSVKENQGFHEVQTKLTDRRASLGCRKIVFFLDLKSYEMRHVHLYFRDGSIVTNRFQSIEKDATIAASKFEVDTAGRTVEKK